MMNYIKVLKILIGLCFSILGIIFKSFSHYFTFLLFCLLSYEFNIAKIHKWRGRILNFLAFISNIALLQATLISMEKAVAYFNNSGFELSNFFAAALALTDKLSLAIYFSIVLTIFFALIITKYNNWADTRIITTRIFNSLKKCDKGEVKYFWGLLRVSSSVSQRFDASMILSGTFFLSLVIFGAVSAVLSSPYPLKWHPWHSYGLEIEYTIIMAVISIVNLIEDKDELETYVLKRVALTEDLLKSILLILVLPIYGISGLFFMRSLAESFLLYDMFQHESLTWVLSDVIEFSIEFFSVVYLAIFPIYVIFYIFFRKKNRKSGQISIPKSIFRFIVTGIAISLLTMGTNIFYNYLLNEYIHNPFKPFSNISVEKLSIPVFLMYSLLILQLIQFIVKEKEYNITIKSPLEDFFILYICLIPFTIIVGYGFIYETELMFTTGAPLIYFVFLLIFYVYGVTHKNFNAIVKKIYLISSIQLDLLFIYISVNSLLALAILPINLLLEDVAALLFGEEGRNKVKFIFGF